MKKRLIGVLLALLMVASLVVGCAKQAATETASAADGAGIKVAVVANQKFGDNGPMDNMKAGVESMVEKHGIEAKYLESSAETFEEDVRAMAEAGYNLIITTFPYMSEATVTVAKEYPKTMFCAIYQFINVGDASYANIWDTEYHGEGAFYVAGWMAGKATQSNVIGFQVGGEEPSPNAEGNGFMRGALAANPNVTVEFACINSYEDTATTYEYTMAMIDKGADIIQGDSGGSNAGMVDAAKEKGQRTGRQRNYGLLRHVQRVQRHHRHRLRRERHPGHRSLYRGHVSRRPAWRYGPCQRRLLHGLGELRALCGQRFRLCSGV